MVIGRRVFGGPLAPNTAPTCRTSWRWPDCALKMERGTAVPCDARVADGAIRGGFVGLLWAGFYGRSEFAASATATTAVLPFAARYTAVSVLSFSAFFGAYSGLLCGAERVFGAESHYSSLIAGGAMGGVIGACLPPRATNAAMIGTTTALISAATSYMLSRGKR